MEASHKEGKQINNEIMVLKTLCHPNVVKYHDSFMEKDYICIVMDYADRGDLQRKIKEMRDEGSMFDHEQILDWFCQICMGLVHIHSKKILHRDLKP